MKKYLLLSILGLAIVRAEEIQQIPSADLQSAIDSRDAKINELESRIRMLDQKLQGFATLYNACENIARIQPAPMPKPVIPFSEKKEPAK